MGALVLGLLALGGCTTEVTGSGSPSPLVNGATPSAEATPPSGGGGSDTVTCEWVPDGSGVDVGTPPEEVPADGTATLVMEVAEVGELVITLDSANAPCAAASTAHLADAGFFDGSPCHRLVDQPAFGVLQCGDPTGTGTGGPGYRFDQEVSADTAYPAGTVAMANSGAPGSTGSQFFLCFVDSQLDPDYTVVGTMDDEGLAIVQDIAAAGDDGSFEPAPGGGAPNTPVTITSMTVVQ